MTNAGLHWPDTSCSVCPQTTSRPHGYCMLSVCLCFVSPAALATAAAQGLFPHLAAGFQGESLALTTTAQSCGPCLAVTALRQGSQLCTVNKAPLWKLKSTKLSKDYDNITASRVVTQALCLASVTSLHCTGFCHTWKQEQIIVLERELLLCCYCWECHKQTVIYPAAEQIFSVLGAVWKTT